MKPDWEKPHWNPKEYSREDQPDIYYNSCPNCGEMVRRETIFLNLKQIDFKCNKCHTKFLVPTSQNKPDIQVAWENGD